MPCKTAPSVIPCADAATKDPSAKAASQYGRCSRVAPAKLERHSAEHEPEQHRDDQRVSGRQDDGIGERERGHQPAAAQDQPGLVAVPDRCDRVHRLIAFGTHGKGGEQDPDAEVEPVHHHVSENREGDDERPDDAQVVAEAHGSPLPVGVLRGRGTYRLALARCDARGALRDVRRFELLRRSASRPIIRSR